MFCKQYIGLSEYHWQRIKDVNRLTSDHKLSPTLLLVDDRRRVLTWEIVTPFECGSDEIPVGLQRSVIDLRYEIRRKVEILHSLGYAHGDLNIGNIGVTNEGEIVFLGFDMAFLISEGREQPWVLEWMREGFDETDYDAFVKYDRSTWKTDFLWQQE